MRERVNRAADEQRERPVKHPAQSAKNAAAKQDFLQRGDDGRRPDGVENGPDNFVRGQVLNHAAPAKPDGDAGDDRQRKKTEQQPAGKFFQLAVRWNQAGSRQEVAPSERISGQSPASARSSKRAIHETVKRRGGDLGKPCATVCASQ